MAKVKVTKSDGDAPSHEEVQVERMAGGQERPYYSPLVDIYQENDDLVLQADMPGVSGANVEVTFENGLLTLNGRVSGSIPGEPDQLYQEYIPGDYHRCFTVSDQVDAEKITARMRDGVLTVRLPRAERARSRRIQVK